MECLSRRNLLTALGLALGVASAAAAQGGDVSNIAPEASANTGVTDNAINDMLRTHAPPGWEPSGMVYSAEGAGCGPCLGDAEGELNCGQPEDDVNGGCNSVPPVFGSIAFGESVCGTSAAVEGTRDTDWYQFTVPPGEPFLVEATLVADFSSVLFFISGTDTCAAPAVVADAFQENCDGVTLNASLEPGVWTVFVSTGNADGSGIFEGIPCGASYELTLDGTADQGACCQANALCTIQSSDECAALNGIFFLGEDCASVDCPDQGPPPNQSCFQSIELMLGEPVEGSTLFSQQTDNVPQCNGITVDSGGAWYKIEGNGTTFTTVVDSLEFGPRVHVYTNTDDLGFCLGDFCCVAAASAGSQSNCCVANGGLGCDDPECESMICSADPFCCDTQWDQICADAANKACAICNAGSGTAVASFCAAPGVTYYMFVSGSSGEAGDFSIVVTSDGQNCEVMKGSCISCPPNATQESEACGGDVNGGCNFTPPTFGSISIGETICGTAWAEDATRDTDWFQFTLEETTTVTITWNSDFERGAFLLDATNCDNILLLFDGSGPGCTPTSGTLVLTAGEYVVFAAQAGFEGAPCELGESCDGSGINYTVSLTAGDICDLTCTGTPEPNACAMGDPGEFASNCCEPNGGLGCDDPECEAIVCAADAFCCETEFDQICADAAIAMCGDLCEPVGGTDDPNGGCNEDPPVFGSISDGETICGQAPAGDGLRDTDWYQFTITSVQDVSVVVASEFQSSTFILDASDCANVLLIAEGYTSDCEEITLTAPALAPGTYALFISPGTPDGGIFEGVVCDVNADYSLTLQLGGGPVEGGACCSAPCECQILDEAACLALGGVYKGDGSVCGPNDSCPDVCSGDLNLDGSVNSVDLNLLLAAFGTSDGGDIDCDGSTTSTDLNLLLAQFGNPCE